MAKRNRARAFIDSFASGYDMGKKIKSDYEDYQVQKTLKSGLKSAQEEADASGKAYLDKGQGDPAKLDYQSKDRGDIDMIARQEDDIAGLQAQGSTPAPSRVAQANQAAETIPLPEERPGLGTPITPANVIAGTPPSSRAAQLPASEAATQAAADAAFAGDAGAPAAPTVATAAPGLTPAPAAAAAPAPLAEAPKGYTQGEKPQLSAMDIFHKKYAPMVTAKLMEQGHLDKSKAFEDWTRSSKGGAYADVYMKALQAEQAGDHHGAMRASVDLYNKQLPDDQYAIAVPSKDGKSYKVQIRNEKTNKLINEFDGKTPDMAQAALAMLTPEKAFNFAWGEQQAAKTAATAAAEKQADRDTKLEAARISASKETPSTAMRLKNERDAMIAADPKDPNILVWNKKIEAANMPATTHVTLTGSMQPLEGGGMGQASNVGGPLKPVPNAADPRKEAVISATNALSGVQPVTPPPTKDNPNPMPYLMRNGVPLYPYGPTKAEYEAVQKHAETLRQAGKPMPWEKAKPGLK